MRYFPEIVATLSLTFVAILSPRIHSVESELGVEIVLSKQTYVVHEPIWLDVTVTNLTPDTIRSHGLFGPNHRQFIIELRDSHGKLVEYTGPSMTFGSGPGQLLLKDGEQDYGSFDLLELFWPKNGNSGYSVLRWRFRHIPNGQYTVQVYFEGAVSNTLTIHIVEPIGEDKEVLKLIEKASSVWAKDNSGPAGRIFQEVVDKYPASVFVEKCFYLQRFYSHYLPMMRSDEISDTKDLDTEMLLKYPNSGSSEGRLLSLTHRLDDDQKLEIYNRYIEDYPNTRCQKFAKQMRDRMLTEKQMK